MPTREQIQKLLDLEPSDPFMLYAMAQDYAKTNEHEEAVEFYKKTIDADEHYNYAYYHMARSLEALGRNEDAAAILDAGLLAAQQSNDGKAISEISQYRTMFA